MEHEPGAGQQALFYLHKWCRSNGATRMSCLVADGSDRKVGWVERALPMRERKLHFAFRDGLEKLDLDLVFGDSGADRVRTAWLGEGDVPALLSGSRTPPSDWKDHTILAALCTRVYCCDVIKHSLSVFLDNRRQTHAKRYEKMEQQRHAFLDDLLTARPNGYPLVPLRSDSRYNWSRIVDG